MADYRLRFEKTGRAKFVSHLDILKIFTRCARRTDLDLVYSQGFNPHAEVVFSAPLPLGTTSCAEYIDISLAEETDPDALLRKLSESLPEGIRPLKIMKLPEGAPNVMKNVAWCRYRLKVIYRAPAGENGECFEQAVENVRARLASGEPVMADKKSKSGVRTVDIAPMIDSFGENVVMVKKSGYFPGNSEMSPANGVEYIPEGPTDAEYEYTFETVLAAGNDRTLRPELAFNALMGDTGAKLAGIHKTDFLDGGLNVLW